MSNLSDLGERKAIQIISDVLSSRDNQPRLDDDCAALDLGDDDFLLVSTDMITEENHIPSGMTPWEIGWFIVAINLSDIAAKGGTPIGLLLSLGLPADTSEVFLKDLIEGANACASEYDTFIVGGDTKETPSITISGSVFGRVKKDLFMSRKGIKSGDLVAVTGALGKAGAGYYVVKHDVNKEKVRDGLLKPSPRLKEGVSLSKTKAVTSCMDISDGLSASLYQLRDLNDVGFKIHKEKVPISSSLVELGEKEGFDFYKYALHFGGDYELLFTISSDRFKDIVKSKAFSEDMFTVIGEVTSSGEVELSSKRGTEKFVNRGYEHFRGNIC